MPYELTLLRSDNSIVRKKKCPNHQSRWRDVVVGETCLYSENGIQRVNNKFRNENIDCT